MPENPTQRKSKNSLQLTRRSFLESIGAATVAAAIPSTSDSSQNEPYAVASPDQRLLLKLDINGTRRSVLVEPRCTLLYVLRDTLELTGTKHGCERGECGACTVLMDGVPRYSCLTLAVEAEGHAITTIEGLLRGEELGSVQQSFAEQDAFQCGYCTSGQILSAEGLLRQNSDPSTEDIRRAMSGNLCRCGTYVHIFRAIQQAATLRKGGAA